MKTSTFSNKDYEKHFQYVRYLCNSITKLKNIFETNNTPWDIVQMEYKNDSRKKTKDETTKSYLDGFKSKLLTTKHINSLSNNKFGGKNKFTAEKNGYPQWIRPMFYKVVDYSMPTRSKMKSTFLR